MHPTLPLFIDNPPGPLPANQSVGALDHHVFNQSTGTWQRTPSHPDFHLHQQFAQHIDPHSQFNMAYAHQQQQQLQQQQQMQQQQQLQQQAQLYHYGQPVQMFNGFVPPSAGGFGPGVWQYQNGIPMGPVGGGMGSGGVGIGLDMNQYAAQGVQGPLSNTAPPPPVPPGINLPSYNIPVTRNIDNISLSSTSGSDSMIFTLHNRYIPETPVRNTKRVSDSMDSEMTKKKRNTSGTPHTVAAPWTPINPNAPAFIPSHAPFHFEGNQDSQIDISQDPVNYGLLQQMGRLAQPLYDKDRIKKPDDIEGYNYKLERWHEMDDDEFCYVGDQVPNPVADAKAGL